LPPATETRYHSWIGTGTYFLLEGTQAEVIQSMSNAHVRIDEIVYVKDDLTKAVYAR